MTRPKVRILVFYFVCQYPFLVPAEENENNLESEDDEDDEKNNEDEEEDMDEEEDYEPGDDDVDGNASP